jgi:hypothetical protein
MNIVQLQDQLKNFSQDQLIREMQMPSGTAPQFLVLGEIMRRQKMQKDFAAQQAKGEPQGTVAEEAIAASGVPQGGIADMARAMAPKTDMAQSTGVQAMATGGPVKKMAEGDRVVIGGVVYIEQADGSLRSASGATPPAGTSEVDRARAAGRESFTLPELLEDKFGVTFGSGPPGQQAVPGPGRSPVPGANEAAAPAAPVAGRTDRDQQGIAAIPTEQELAAEAAAADQNQPTPPSGGGTGGGAGGMSSFEQELMNAIGRREKAAEQDKWLALAQVGLNMMSSTQPTLLGAIGEAGLTGIEAARSARDQYDKDRMDLMTALEQSRQSRAAAAAAAARGASGSSGGIRPLSASGIMTQQKYMLDLAESRLASLTGGQDPVSFAAMLSEAAQGGDTMAASQLMALDAAQKQYESAYGNYMSAANQLGALTMTAPEEDDTQFSAADQ